MCVSAATFGLLIGWFELVGPCFAGQDGCYLPKLGEFGLGGGLRIEHLISERVPGFGRLCTRTPQNKVVFVQAREFLCSIKTSTTYKNPRIVSRCSSYLLGDQLPTLRRNFL